MTNTVFAPISTQSIIHLGAPQVGAKVYFYGAGGTTPRAIWTDKNATISASNPVIADGDGVIPPIWVSGTADYRIVINTAAGVLIRTIENLQGATVEVAGGGGGGTSSYALVTGDIKINFDTAEQSGFVKLNGNSIGNSGSGAHYADDLLTDLFTYLWNRISDTWCPVSGGRGANAAADFVAGKQLTLPDGRFRTFRGLSGMGASTSGQAVDYAGASNPGFQGGSSRKTLITGNMPSHTHTGTTAGGSGTISGTTSVDGAHSHAGATTDTQGTHNHSYTQPASGAILVGGSGSVFASYMVASASAVTGDNGSHSHNVTVPSGGTHSHSLASADPTTHTHGFNTDATGSGTPVDAVTPFIAGTFYMKT